MTETKRKAAAPCRVCGSLEVAISSAKRYQKLFTSVFMLIGMTLRVKRFGEMGCQGVPHEQ